MTATQIRLPVAAESILPQGLMTKGTVMEGFAACFVDLGDPRSGNAGRHDMLEMLVIATCTLLTGGEDCTDMADVAETKLDFLRGFRKLEHSAPSHDTFSRLFRLLDPEQFRACFQSFVRRFAETCRGVVAIDGKVLRRSFDTASGQSALHMVAAWACEQQLVLGQIATEAKSNEITAVPKLPKLLSLEGCTVTVDALNCQRAIAQQIVDQQGDDVVALKANQAMLHDDVRRFLDDPDSDAISARPVVDGNHGRIETRTATVSTDIAWLQKQHTWPGLMAIGKFHRVRETAGKATEETAYYPLSATLTPQRFGDATPAHWGIENRLHWQLDVGMNEDQARNRLGHGPENLAVLHDIASNLLRKEPSKGSLPKKLRRAARRESLPTQRSGSSLKGDCPDGTTIEQLLGTVGIGTINVLMTFVAIATVDRLGRRPLFIIAFAGTAASLLIIAGSMGPAACRRWSA